MATHPHSRFASIVATAAFAALGGVSVSATPLPVEFFATLPSISDVELSPDGQRIAWADRSTSEERAVVFDLQVGRITRQFSVGTSMKLDDLRWSDDATLLIDVEQIHHIPTVARLHDVVSRTIAADITTGEARVLLMSDMARQYITVSHLIAWRTSQPKTAIMSALDQVRYNWIQTLFAVDTHTGKGRILERGTSYTDDWVVDADGKPVARSEWTPGPHYRLLAKHGGGWREIYERSDGSWLELHGVSSDGTAILATGPRDKGRRVLWSIPLDGSGAKILFEDPENEVISVSRDRFTGLPVRLRLGGAEQPYHWLDSRSEARQQSLARAFKDRRVLLFGSSQDGKRLLAAVDGPSQPVVYYIVDLTTHRADIVGEQYPALAGAKFAEVRILHSTSRDGLVITSYLTLPQDASPRRLPLVVLVHDGPADRDDYAFDWWAQFLASRGYAVLQPQFRGSWGFGEDFREKGNGQWGRGMQDDITDAVRSVIDSGSVDAKRVCIMGLGYGGYAALAGAAFTPELYACAVSVNGVSNLPDMLGALRKLSGKEYLRLGYWFDSIGSQFDPNVIDRSPVRAAAQMTAPILLMHSENDTVIPFWQSEQLSRELSYAGKSVTLVRVPGDDHWLSRGETRRRMLTEIERFLADHI
jgi:dipeptidyl aminopeptidase/acylaminoacyl peptidase